MLAGAIASASPLAMAGGGGGSRS